MTGSITREVKIADINPQELAAVFAEMWAEEQAVFFAEVGRIAKGWPGAGMCQQSCAIAKLLTNEGREVIRALASHALPEFESLSA